MLSKLVCDPQFQIPESAKALGIMHYFLTGLPVIDQEQELGMKNNKRTDISQFNDVSSLNNYEMALKEGYTP